MSALVRARVLFACSFVPLGCGTAPAPIARPQPFVRPKPEAPAGPASRWVELRGGSSAGVRASGGRLVLLGGERVLVAPDGKLTREHARSPVPLAGLGAVPTNDGAVIVGWGNTTLVRFDDPLGEGKRIATMSHAIVGVASAPGAIAVRTTADTVWMDLQGRPAQAPRLPLLASSVAFEDMQRGIANVELAGVVVTRDGGLTWRNAAVEPTTDLDARDGLRAGSSRVDPETGAASAYDVASEPDLVRWLRAVRQSPLEVAIAGGVAHGNGKAVAIAAGRLVEIDLESGNVGLASAPLVTTDRLETWLPLRLAPAKVAFVSPFVGGMPVRTAEIDLAKTPLALGGAGMGPQGAIGRSASGGLSFQAPCKPEDAKAGAVSFCVRQPDGSFRTIGVEPGFAQVTAPSASGGLVGVNEGKREMARISRDGKVTKSAFEAPAGPIVAFDEVDDKTVHVIVRREDDHMSMRFEGGTMAGAKNLPANLFRYSAGYGFFEQDGVFRVTSDAGGTWTDVTLPLDTSMESASELAVGEVGLRIGRWMRIGWNPGPTPGREQPEVFSPTFVARPPPGANWQTCQQNATQKSLVPRIASNEIDAVINKPISVMATKFKTVARTFLRTEAALVVTSSRIGLPTWTFHWIDLTEVGAKVRSVSAPVSHGASRTLTFAFSSGDKAFFGWQADGRRHFARVVGGRIETAPVDFAVDDAAIAFDGSIAWSGGGKVGVWLAREEPRALAKVRPGRLAVAAPEKGILPLLATSLEGAAYAELPIPKAKKGAPAAELAWLDASLFRSSPVVPRTIWTTSSACSLP